MRRNVALPHLVVPDEFITFRGFMIGTPGEPLSLARDTLDDWDYNRNLEVRCRLDVNFNKAAEFLCIPSDQLVLHIELRAGTGAGSLPRRIECLGSSKADERTGKIELTAIVDSSRLSGRLLLECSISLADTPARTMSVLAPALVGARLWSSQSDIALEDGTSSRFPVEIASFAKVFSGQSYERAPWFVRWRPQSLDADFGGAVRLFVNSDNDEILTRFIEGDPATLQAMLGDLISQIVRTAISSENLDEVIREAREGSIGSQVANWLDMAFPGKDSHWIRHLAANSPGVFHSALLAAAEFD